VSLGVLLALAFEALRAHRMRYGLSALAIAVGISSVVLMSSLGEGMLRFIQQQVSSFGTTLVGVHPGKISTGGMPGGMGGSARHLTIDDAKALRRIPGVVSAIPTAYGTGLVEYGRRGRRVFVYGVTAQMPRAWSIRIATGQNLPDLDWDRGSPFVLLGPRLKRELFGDANPIGAVVRIHRMRFRVCGVVETKGQFLGFDIDDAAYVQVASAMRLFNSPELQEVDLVAATVEESELLAERARVLMKERHGGQEDVTIVTQKDAMEMMSNILRVVSGAVTAIAAISLLVGAIGIFTILWIVVGERTQEIGLVMSLGGKRSQILAWYLCEAAITAGIGGVLGLTAGGGGAWLLTRFVPGLESYTPPWLVIAALATAMVVGLGAGVAPALRAAGLDPVEALRAE
jgi:putative ABC transport system permease protein